MDCMDDRIHISLRRSGKTTRIINKAIELLKKENPIKVIIVVDIPQQERLIYSIINKEIDKIKLNKQLEILSVRPYDDHQYEFSRWYLTLKKYCVDEYNCENEIPIKVLVDSDISRVVKDITLDNYISRCIELIEIPIEMLITDVR